MLKWEKIESESNRWIETVKCEQVKLDDGQKGCFVRYPGKDDVYFTFATSVYSYESLPNLEDWYIEGNDIYVKFPDARQHIGKIL